MNKSCRIRRSGFRDYVQVANEMLAFTDGRTKDTDDELWLLQHHPVFTQGTSCNQQPRTNPTGIPVVKSSRGGQISYHGPGQLIAYLLFDIKRLGIGPKSLVNHVEQAIIQLLGSYGLLSERRQGAPGVYVNSAKIAALGLRIRNGKCFHGLSLNVDMDLTPFQLIDPCGYPGMTVTQLTDLGIHHNIRQVGDDLIDTMQKQFQWDSID
ncbi:MAG: lipoyl(octanoyl) transferase LipB [Arenicellales bacterium]